MRLSADEMNKKCMDKWLDAFYENYLENSEGLGCPYVVFSTSGYTGHMPINKTTEYVESIVNAEMPKYISDALVKLKEDGYIINTVIKPIGNTPDPGYINVEIIVRS